MRRLTFSDDSQDNIAEIFAHIERESGSTDIAERPARRLVRRCRRLAALPGMIGRSRRELLSDIRSVVEGSYVIFFPYRDEALEVVNILKGHRDIDAFFAARNDDAV